MTVQFIHDTYIQKDIVNTKNNTIQHNMLLLHWHRSGKVTLQAYVDYVNTGKHKELAPYDKDWYYIRAGEYVFMSLHSVDLLPWTSVS